jgi:hypothetical protein
VDHVPPVDAGTHPNRALGLALAGGLLGVDAGTVESGHELLKVSNRTPHDGRIHPMLFGNFIELFDDLTPGMWAEMLNDRGFEGIIPPATWVYFDGSPTCCDRAWDMSHDWTTTEDDKSFTGRRCAKIVANGDRPARLSQSGLAVKQGARYHVSGWIRSEGSVRVQVALETPAPDGSIIELATVDPWEPTAQYTRFSATLQPKGSSDRVAFVVRGIGKGTVWADQLSLMPEANRRGWSYAWRNRLASARQQRRDALVVQVGFGNATAILHGTAQSEKRSTARSLPTRSRLVLSQDDQALVAGVTGLDRNHLEVLAPFPADPVGPVATDDAVPGLTGPEKRDVVR